MGVTIAALGCDGPPSKRRDGQFVILCPYCGEMQVAINSRNNLAHSFDCHKNLNNIDLLMTFGYDFVTAVTILQGWLDRHQSRLPKTPMTQPE